MVLEWSKVAHCSCCHGQRSRTPSAPAGWVPSKLRGSLLRQGTDKSVSLVDELTVATCHSISGLLELYAQWIAPIGRLNCGRAEISASGDLLFSWPTSWSSCSWAGATGSKRFCGCQELDPGSHLPPQNSVLTVLQFEKKLLCVSFTTMKWIFIQYFHYDFLMLFIETT